MLLLGMFLGSLGPIAAQTPVPRIVLAQEHVAPIITTLQKISNPLPVASFLLFQDPAKSNAHFSFLFAGAYQRDYSLDHLSPMDEVKTLILTQASLPLLRFWGGRLQLDAFQSTLHIQSVQLGLVGVGRMRGSLVPGQESRAYGQRRRGQAARSECEACSERRPVATVRPRIGGAASSPA